VNRPLTSVEDLRGAAREIFERWGCAALVKGGHLRGLNEAVDIFFDGNLELLLSAPFVKGIGTHGTGCTYSAAITAGLANGLPLTKAVAQAKQFISHAIASSRHVGDYWALGWNS
jgi:hydroxymethylpyrimidine/phosphomethylpyrimidine kinase